jgi:putative peptidoglycan lipid II flippase
MTGDAPGQPFYKLLAAVFGGSLVVQLLAFVRQLVIASAFGIDRTMDLYLLLFSVAGIVAFGMGAVMENAAVPRLVPMIEAGDRATFRAAATRLMLLCVLMSVAALAVFAAAVPIFAHFIATGLTAGEKAEMLRIAPWFAPWILLSIPFYGAGCLLKSERRFPRFFAAEIIVTVVSLVVITLWQSHVGAIAMAYGLGYGIGLLSMLLGGGVRMGTMRGAPSLGLRRQIFRVFGANQVSTLTTLADRFLQSQLPPGAISASSYSNLIAQQTANLLGFRDAFMVPLSQQAERSRKLERAMAGLALLSIPVAVFIWHEARPIVGLLLERGRFDRAAGDLTALFLAWQAIAIPFGVVGLPMFRMLQILDRMRYTAYVLLAIAAMTLSFGSIALFWLKAGIVGYAAAATLTSCLTIVLTGIFLHRSGMRLEWLWVARHAGAALTASVAAAALMAQFQTEAHLLWGLLRDGLIYGAVLGLAGALGWRHIKAILRGQA